MEELKEQDVLIIGGGVSGTALLYLLAHYTDIQKITLLEKYDAIASVNSHGRNNSQTLHCGDIETNYTIEKARQVQRTAKMVVDYAKKLPNKDKIIYKFSKMVIGVGSDECESLRQRYEIFKPYYENMQIFNAKDIEKLEPTVTRGREEEIIALGVTDEYSAVNFQALSQSFVEQAQTIQNKEINVLMNTKVRTITKTDDGYEVLTSKGIYRSQFVVVSAGGHSLLFAQKMGYGQEYSCLPMAGSFYYAPHALNGKVYTVQNDKLPFAAIHGDPDVLVSGKTRFGPTALALPLLERYNIRTFPEFLQVFKPDTDVIKTLWGLLKVPDIRNYLFKNILFEVPLLRKRLFLKDARKIIPGMQLRDLSYAKRTGGIRPVMIDKKNHKLHLGEAQLNPGNGIIFNMTPSPGATSCLGNAEKDMKIIINYLGADFDQDSFERDLHGKT